MYGGISNFVWWNALNPRESVTAITELDAVNQELRKNHQNYDGSLEAKVMIKQAEAAKDATKANIEIWVGAA